MSEKPGQLPPNNPDFNPIEDGLVPNGVIDYAGPEAIPSDLEPGTESYTNALREVAVRDLIDVNLEPEHQATAVSTTQETGLFGRPKTVITKLTGEAAIRGVLDGTASLRLRPEQQERANEENAYIKEQISARE